jgi:hypothetical protein
MLWYHWHTADSATHVPEVSENVPFAATEVRWAVLRHSPVPHYAVRGGQERVHVRQIRTGRGVLLAAAPCIGAICHVTILLFALHRAYRGTMSSKSRDWFVGDSKLYASGDPSSCMPSETSRAELLNMCT